MNKSILCALSMCVLIAATGCGGSSEGTGEISKEQAQQTARGLAESKKNMDEITQLNEMYSKTPDYQMLENNGASSPVYKEMQQRYKSQLEKMKAEVEATGAKFIVVMISPEVGKAMSDLTRYGHPFIKSTCNELGIEVYDFSAAIAAQDPKVITQVPRDGHWSKKGAIFLADQLDPIIKKHKDHRSTQKYQDSERPETFGDLAPSTTEVLDGGKDMPYKVVANAQGVRMDHDLKFPKTKQHVLFLGGSQLFSPFLDNEFIATTLLAQRHPEMEMINAAMIAGCTDDFLSLWNEKAKYSEPDVVIMQTNGTDITDLFFTNRNHLARSKKPYQPSPVEEKFYNDRYRK